MAIFSYAVSTVPWHVLAPMGNNGRLVETTKKSTQFPCHCRGVLF
jgi:hypothetical protein